MRFQAYIQEQYSDFSPLLEPIGGYAFFVDLFDVKSSVHGEFEAFGDKVLLNEIISRKEVITLGQRGESRSQTAVSGTLESGDYSFKLVLNDKVEAHLIRFKGSILEVPVVKVLKINDKTVVSWNLERATSFWIFAVPERNYSSYSELFKLLVPLTENRFKGNQFQMKTNPFGEGVQYRIIVRANFEEEVSGVPRFSKETWGISDIITG